VFILCTKCNLIDDLETNALLCFLGEKTERNVGKIARAGSKSR